MSDAIFDGPFGTFTTIAGCVIFVVALVRLVHTARRPSCRDCRARRVPSWGALCPPCTRYREVFMDQWSR